MTFCRVQWLLECSQVLLTVVTVGSERIDQTKQTNQPTNQPTKLINQTNQPNQTTNNTIHQPSKQPNQLTNYLLAWLPTL